MDALADYDYDLSPERIAQAPARPRDAARLMVLPRETGRIEHRGFRELPALLDPSDLVVMNDTRVIPAAVTARRATGGRIEGCFLRERADGLWEMLLAGRGRIREGETLALVDAEGEAAAEITLRKRGERGLWHVRPPAGTDATALLERVGRPPLPPYIRRDAADPLDREDYQTVYACRDGAVAAPTAGLHFTPRVLAAMDARGIERARVTLHVGPGTFQPITVERLAAHQMHEEAYEVPPETAEAVRAARVARRRIVAVGTTTVRTLESAAGEGGEVRAGPGMTRLFIRPPHAFRAVDAMITNFHLPRTTLLVMVAAFAGRERILEAYEEAMRAGYRFYSYGDAMLIV